MKAYPTVGIIGIQGALRGGVSCLLGMQHIASVRGECQLFMMHDTIAMHSMHVITENLHQLQVPGLRDSMTCRRLHLA